MEFGRKWNLNRVVTATGGECGQGEGISEAFAQWDASTRTTVRVDWGRLKLGEGTFRGNRAGLSFRTAEPGKRYCNTVWKT